MPNTRSARFRGRSRALGHGLLGIHQERQRALAAANARRKWRANTLKWGMALPGRAARGAYGLGAAGVHGLRSLSLLRRSKNAARAAGRGVAAAGLGALGLGAMGLGALGRGAVAAGRGVYRLGAAGLTKTRSGLRALDAVVAGDKRLDKFYTIGENGQPKIKEGVNAANIPAMYRGTGSWLRNLTRGKWSRLTKNANTRVLERYESARKRQANRLQRLRNSAGSFGSSAPGAPGGSGASVIAAAENNNNAAAHAWAAGLPGKIGPLPPGRPGGRVPLLAGPPGFKPPAAGNKPAGRWSFWPFGKKNNGPSGKANTQKNKTARKWYQFWKHGNKGPMPAGPPAPAAPGGKTNKPGNKPPGRWSFWPFGKKNNGPSAKPNTQKSNSGKKWYQFWKRGNKGPTPPGPPPAALLKRVMRLSGTRSARALPGRSLLNTNGQNARFLRRFKKQEQQKYNTMMNMQAAMASNAAMRKYPALNIKSLPQGVTAKIARMAAKKAEALGNKISATKANNIAQGVAGPVKQAIAEVAQQTVGAVGKSPELLIMHPAAVGAAAAAAAAVVTPQTVAAEAKKGSPAPPTQNLVKSASTAAAAAAAAAKEASATLSGQKRARVGSAK